MLREFKDSAGTQWRVWEVTPNVRTFTKSAETANASAMPFPSMEMSAGWLCFECGAEKRRLAPIPPEWEICDDTMLEELCARAGFVSRPTPPDGPREIQR